MPDLNDPKATLLRYLDSNREALLFKLDGLSEYDVRRPLTPTGTNLLGLVKHLALVEFGYFGEVLDRTPQASVRWFRAEYDAIGAVPNSDLYATAEQTRDEVVALYHQAGANTAATVAALDLDAPGRVAWWGEKGAVTLHRILVHMIAETARHTGQADILREMLDGSAGLRADNDNLAELDAEGWIEYRAELQAIADGFAG